MSETMTASQHREWTAIFDDLRETLVKAQGERDQRRQIVNGQPLWIDYEIGVMVDRVNQLRARRAALPVATHEVAAKDQMACGHVDYTKKFALYCADLVVGR